MRIRWGVEFALKGGFLSIGLKPFASDSYEERLPQPVWELTLSVCFIFLKVKRGKAPSE